MTRLDWLEEVSIPSGNAGLRLTDLGRALLRDEETAGDADGGLKMALEQRMHASGESANTIAAALGVSRATDYRVLADDDGTEG